MNHSPGPTFTSTSRRGSSSISYALNFPAASFSSISSQVEIPRILQHPESTGKTRRVDREVSRPRERSLKRTVAAAPSRQSSTRVDRGFDGSSEPG